MSSPNCRPAASTSTIRARSSRATSVSAAKASSPSRSRTCPSSIAAPYCTSGPRAAARSTPVTSARPARIDTYCCKRAAMDRLVEVVGDAIAHEVERQLLAVDAPIEAHDVEAVAGLDRLAVQARPASCRAAPARTRRRSGLVRPGRDCRPAAPMGSRSARPPRRQSPAAAAAARRSTSPRSAAPSRGPRRRRARRRIRMCATSNRSGERKRRRLAVVVAPAGGLVGVRHDDLALEQGAQARLLRRLACGPRRRRSARPRSPRRSASCDQKLADGERARRQLPRHVGIGRLVMLRLARDRGTRDGHAVDADRDRAGEAAAGGTRRGGRLRGVHGVHSAGWRVGAAGRRVRTTW